MYKYSQAQYIIEIMNRTNKALRALTVALGGALKQSNRPTTNKVQNLTCHSANIKLHCEPKKKQNVSVISSTEPRQF